MNISRTWVQRVIGKGHFIKSNGANTTVDVFNGFSKSYSRTINFQIVLLLGVTADSELEFCKRAMEKCEVQLKLSSNRHVQKGGASEISNRLVQNYIRCYFSYHEDDGMSYYLPLRLLIVHLSQTILASLHLSCIQDGCGRHLLNFMSNT